MKTLEKHTIIYDSDCPLCKAYTNAFVSTRMLDIQGRIPYQQVGGSFCPEMDAERAKNEIALVDRETGKVRYGLDSLLHVLHFRFPMLSNVVRSQPIHFLVNQLYSLISYNRKVIMPAVRKGESTFDCTPSFNLQYRLLYIVMTWLITSVVLVKYSTFLTGFIPATNFTREFLICGGQGAFQLIAVFRLAKDKTMDYLGNMMTVSLFGALLLLPMLLIGSLFSAIPEALFLVYFMAVVAVMLYEHARRMKILELGWWPSISWVLYRAIVLIIIVL